MTPLDKLRAAHEAVNRTWAVVDHDALAREHDAVGEYLASLSPAIDPAWCERTRAAFEHAREATIGEELLEAAEEAEKP
jgi:hypothetical protein